MVPETALTTRILLAEDDNDMRRFLVKALENAGYDVASFDNGLSAYNRLREEPFELLLTDIVMPEMDGIELARRATELDPDIKVMFITGFAAVALNPDRRPRRTPRCCPSPSTCGISSTRSRSCCGRLNARSSRRPLSRRLPSLRTEPLYPRHSRSASGRCRARSSAGEHYVDIVGVTGSIPVAPTISKALDIASTKRRPGLFRFGPVKPDRGSRPRLNDNYQISLSATLRVT